MKENVFKTIEKAAEECRKNPAIFENRTKVAEMLAKSLSDKELETSDNVKSLLGDTLPEWEWRDWYELLKAVRQSKYRAEHEAETAEKIHDRMPFFAREAAQFCVRQLLKAAKENRINRLDKAAEDTAEILFCMFHCCTADINETARRVSQLLGDDFRNGQLLQFIETLRERLWEQGEVLRLRGKTL